MPNLKVNPDHLPVLQLLEQCPVHKPTSISCQVHAADQLGIESLWIKHEGERMGLGSFKALGGSFAILSLLCEAAGISTNGRVDIQDPAFREAAQSKTFVCATAGNHGLSVAASASLFGAKSVIYLAASVPEEFADRLRQKGAEVVRAGSIYEEALAAAVEAGENNGWILVADTSNSNYQEIPALIYQGYSVLAEECRAYFDQHSDWPSHVFLQAGVGGMASSFAAHIRKFWPGEITIVIVEPAAAPCLGRSIAAGKMIVVEGPVSNMGRLDCKENSLLCYESLSETADLFVELTEEEGAQAVVDLAAIEVETTPSGGAGYAGLKQLLDRNQIPASAKCLIIASEGALS
ncbi:MAG: pyridoxal-phosphate dependent enzyme [Acidiferrobacterales bacterium]|nr:pyridoxal-phosphate dependent enzyme [Acidiferrobacterales bacterium]